MGCPHSRILCAIIIKQEDQFMLTNAFLPIVLGAFRYDRCLFGLCQSPSNWLVTAESKKLPTKSISAPWCSWQANISVWQCLPDLYRCTLLWPWLANSRSIPSWSSLFRRRRLYRYVYSDPRQCPHSCCGQYQRFSGGIRCCLFRRVNYGAYCRINGASRYWRPLLLHGR